MFNNNKTVIVVFLLMIGMSSSNDYKNIVDQKSEILPSCQACKAVVESFLTKVEKVKQKLNLKTKEPIDDFKITNEVFNEIEKQICLDVVRGQTQCYTLAEGWKHYLKEWSSEQKSLGNLHDWLCVDKVQSCCAVNHFGPECKPCEGYPDNVCSNNGKCKGSGTRKGNGECDCSAGYTGRSCNQCAESYYESYRDDKKMLCSKCHISCKGPCVKAGRKGCTECNVGWLKDGERGCLDVNECTAKDACKPNRFCVNNEGSYSCLLCDSSCDGCHGDGPDMCNKCAAGFTFKDGFCLGGDKESLIDWTRYCTYFGLCVATCIIFQKNTIIASIVGLSVAIYVTTSEYMLNTVPNPAPKHTFEYDKF